MSVIKEYKDPMSGKINNFAKGSIKFVSIKPVRNPDPDGVKRTHIPARNGQPAKVIESTHTISFLMQDVDDNNNVIDPAGQGEWISMGEKKLHANHTDKVQVKKDDAGYKDILPGMVVSFPLKVTQNGDKTYANGTLSGKVFNILDESKAGQAAPRQQSAASSQAASGASNASGGKTTKVYGEILSVDGTSAQVKNEDGNTVKVILTAEQFSQIQVGGRLAGQVDEKGSVVSNFKVYGPKGSAPAGGSRSNSKKDNSGIETGHALNGALNLRRAGLTLPPVAEIAKVVHDVTKHLKQESANDPANKGMSDYDVGAMVGHAVLNATRDVIVAEDDNPEVITEKLLGYSRELLGQVVPLVSAYVKGEGLAEAANSQPEPNLQPKEEEAVVHKVNDNGNVDMSPPPMDFDDDIPF